jgi:hypothetical protein
VKIPNTTSSGTQTKERTPLGDRCTTVDIRMKNRFSNTDSNVDITTYQCGFFALGSVSNGKTSTILNSIDEIKGSLHPMRIGARMSIRTRTASLTDAKHGYSNASSCEVVSQSPASELDGRLTGKAWKMRCTGSFTSNYNDKTTTSDSDNYYLEDLGVYLSEIGEFELEQKKFYIPRKGEQRRNKVGDTAIQTKTWHSYEWTAGR